MTVLTGFERLEATAMWRPINQAGPREVLVSLGKATLAILDDGARPLAHWSLPAIVRRNPGIRPARFAPGADAREELEIDDDTMIDAIGRIQTALTHRRAGRNRLRGPALWGAAGLAIAAAIWSPDMLFDYAISVVPVAVQDETGRELERIVGETVGATCAAPQARAPLARLSRRALGPDGGRIAVAAGNLDRAIFLPGRIVLIGRDLIEREDGPDVAAGFVLAERVRAELRDPIADLIDHAGIWAAMRFLATGRISEGVLRDYAARLVAGPRDEVPVAPLFAEFAKADLGAAPYAIALLRSDDNAATNLLEADPTPPDPARPIMSDGDWVSLQSICTG